MKLFLGRVLRNRILGIILGICVASTSWAAVEFTEDVNVILTGISAGDLQIVTGSQSASLDVSGANFTITDIASGDFFHLKTPLHTTALKITPTGATVDLTLTASNISSDSIIQWALNSAGTSSVDFIVGTAKASTLYSVKIGGVEYNQYTSTAGKQITFPYTAGGDAKVFTIEEVGVTPEVEIPVSGGGGSYSGGATGSNSSDATSAYQSAAKGDTLTNVSCRFEDQSLYEKGGLRMGSEWLEINGERVVHDTEIIKYTNPPSEFATPQPKVVDIFFAEELKESKFASFQQLEVSCGMKDLSGRWNTTKFIYQNKDFVKPEPKVKEILKEKYEKTYIEKVAETKVRPKSTCREKIFRDVPEGAWSREYVDKAYCAGIMTGYDQSRYFGAQDSTTRVELLKSALLASEVYIPTEVNYMPYPDVPLDAWFAPYVKAAKDLGLIDQVFPRGQRQFYPLKPITRAEALEVLAFLDEAKLSRYKDSVFVDVSARHDFAPSVNWAYENGIVDGYEPLSDGRKYFGPRDNLTRSQLAKIIVNYMDVLKERYRKRFVQ